MVNRLMWLFPLSGGLYGWALWYLLDHFDEHSLYAPSLLVFIIVAAYCCWFAIGVRKLWGDILFSVLVSGLAAGQVAVFQHLVGFDHVDDTAVGGLIAAQAVWVALVVAIWRSTLQPLSVKPGDASLFQEQGVTNDPDHDDSGQSADSSYPLIRVSQIGPQIWNIKLSLSFGVVAIGVFWVMAYLLAILFNLVGFTAFMDFLETGLGGSVLSGAAFATGIMLTREKPNLLRAVRQVLGTLYRFFYPFQAFGVFLFLLLGALGGWEQLLGQDTSIWLVVTSASLWLSYLLFGAIQSGAKTTLFGRWGDFVFRYTLWMAPLCALLGIGTIWVRVDDYGLTPQRIYGSWIVVAVLVATLWIMRAGMTRGNGMIIALQRAFGHVAIGATICAFLIHLPWLDPVSIAARNQQARLLHVEDINQSDLAFMAQQLGKPGEQAVMDLKQVYPDTVPELAELRLMPTILKQRRDSAADQIPVFPEDQPYSHDALSQMMDKDLQFDRQFCKEDGLSEQAAKAQNKCALLIVDMDGDGVDEAVFFSLRPVAAMLKYRPEEKDWIKVRDLYLSNGNANIDIIDQLQQGDFKPEVPAYSDLSVGGILWEQSR
jgi:hypothetical protein